MGRASIIIDKDKLKEEIDKAEAAKTFDNQARLFEYICHTPWAQTIVDSTGKSRIVSPATIYQRCLEYGIVLKTPKGKKGGISGAKGGKRARKIGTNLAKLLKSTPEKYHKLAKKSANGSLIAKVKLKCLDCCCWQRSEVMACRDENCPLWDAFKRNSGKTKEDEDTDIED
jgi:hypothetical protein